MTGDAILKIQDELLKRDQPIFELAKEIQVARHRMEQAIKHAGPIGRAVLYKTLDDDIRYQGYTGTRSYDARRGGSLLHRHR